MDKLNEWFKRFGTIVNIQIDLNALRAVIQFTDFNDAKSAFNSPDAVFGNRFVKVFWHRADETPASVVGSLGEGGVVSAEAALASYSTTGPYVPPQPRVMNLPPPNTPMSVNFVADKQKTLMTELANQKAALLERQIEHQKALLEKLQSPGLSDEERSEIMDAIRRSEDMGKRMNNVEEAVDPALLEKLEMLKQQVCGSTLEIYSRRLKMELIRRLSLQDEGGADTAVVQPIEEGEEVAGRRVVEEITRAEERDPSHLIYDRRG